MPPLVLLITLMLPALALAQAPVEDSGVRGDSFVEAQQRVEFARRAAEQADQRMAAAEGAVKTADTALASARKQFDEAKAGADKARRELEQARAKAGESHKMYEREATEFERLRRGGSARKS